MSYIGGPNVYALFDSYYGSLTHGAREETCELTCQECGKQGVLRLPHSTKDIEIVKAFRNKKWTVNDNGKGALCPKCGKAKNVKNS